MTTICFSCRRWFTFVISCERIETVTSSHRSRNYVLIYRRRCHLANIKEQNDALSQNWPHLPRRNIAEIRGSWTCSVFLLPAVSFLVEYDYQQVSAFFLISLNPHASKHKLLSRIGLYTVVHYAVLEAVRAVYGMWQIWPLCKKDKKLSWCWQQAWRV